MDDGELECSNQELFSSQNMGGELLSSSSFNGFLDLDGLFKEAPPQACIHTHTCNPPGPDHKHTHTCFHAHIASAPTEEDEAANEAESTEKKTKKRPSGNRDAVRKYREKKKARAASLEDEVVRLRALNQQLVKKLQGQAALEAEIARLRCLLVDIRGRIDGEIGTFPYQKSIDPNLNSLNMMSNIGGPGMGAYMMNPCNLQCDDQLHCHQLGGLDGKNGDGGTGIDGQGTRACELENNFQCSAGQNLSGSKKFPGR